MLSTIQIRSFILVSIFLSNICCVESASSSISQQISNQTHNQDVNSSFTENNPLEELVKTYCQLATEENDAKLKDLIAKNSTNGNNQNQHKHKKNDGEAPDADKFFDEQDSLFLIKTLPELIYIGKFQVKQMETTSANAKTGKVKVLLQSTKYSTEKLSITFYLKKERRKWKVYKARHSGLDY